MKMHFFKSSMMATLMATTLCTGIASCSDKDDVESTLNP